MLMMNNNDQWQRLVEDARGNDADADDDDDDDDDGEQQRPMAKIS